MGFSVGGDMSMFLGYGVVLTDLVGFKTGLLL